VTLVGLVAKNGILIVEFANKLQEQGLSKVAAVQEAAVTRLRPILMTSVATVCGHFPLVLVTGPGAEARNSIGLVLVAGMTIGTAFTLFFVPAIYLLIARDHRGELAEVRPEEAGLETGVSRRRRASHSAPALFRVEGEGPPEPHER
jgi:multidrug efflux pump